MGQNSPFWGRAVKGNQGQSHSLYKRAPCGQISGGDRKSAANQVGYIRPKSSGISEKIWEKEKHCN